MNAKYTSGPWQSRDDQTTDGFVTIIANIDGEYVNGSPSYTYDVIARCEDESGERLPNVAANVRLICAAPDLAEALRKIAAFNDVLASEYLEETGSYGRFDEPHSVFIARSALASAGVE